MLFDNSNSNSGAANKNSGRLLVPQHLIEKRILLVDDSASILTNFPHILNVMGFSNVTPAAGIGQALKLLKEQEFDLVLMEPYIVFQGTDLSEFVNRVKESGKNPPLIMHTTDPKLALEYQEHGFAGALRKPASLDCLMQTILSVLDARSSEPKLDEANPIASLNQKSMPETNPAELLKQKSILIVDDDEELRDTISETLGQSGFSNLTLVGNPPEALELLKSNKFDLLISDFKMPGMTGIELAHAILAAGISIPIILATGTPGEVPDSEVRLFSAICCKPFNYPLFENAILNTLKANNPS